MLLQRTIRERVRVEGIGLHTACQTALTFCPAPTGSGIHFIRNDLPGRPTISTHVREVSATSMATTLGQAERAVSTVEHCLSVVSACRLDNLFIELDAPEVPIVDGSARLFMDAVKKAGIVEQDMPRQYAVIKEPIFFGSVEKHAYVVPYNGLRVTCTIDFPHPSIGLQKFDLDVNEVSFDQEIASARTFGFLKDVEALRARGLARGGGLENAIVLNEDSVMNPEGLRWADEFVRHKVLDALGDLVTLGYPLMGHLVLFKAGHDLVNSLVRKVLESKDRWRLQQWGVASEFD